MIQTNNDLNAYLEQEVEVEGIISGFSTPFNHKDFFSKFEDLIRYRFLQIFVKESEENILCLVSGNINNLLDEETGNLTQKIKLKGLVKILPYNLSEVKGVEAYDGPLILINKLELLKIEKTEFSKTEIKEFENFSKSKTALQDAISLVAPNIIGSDPLKESMMLQHIGSNNDHFHILFLGDAGTGKTVSMQENLKLAQNPIYSLASNYGKDFITYNFKKNFVIQHCNLLTLGKFMIMKNAVFGFDEISRFVDKKVKNDFENILKRNQLEVFEDGFSFNIDIENSILAASNQKVDDFAKKSVEQRRLLELFDLVFVIEDITKNDLTAVELLTTGILNHLTDNLEVNSNISKEFLKNYLTYTRENFRPSLTDKAIDLLKNKWNGLLDITRSDYSPIKIGERQLLALRRLSEAYAKFYCQNEVLVEHVELAYRLFMRCFETHNPLNTDSSLNTARLSKEAQNTASKKTIFMQSLLNLKQKHGVDFVDYNELSEILLKAGFESNSEIEETLKKLRQEGEIFEPRKNILKSISDS